MPGLSSYGMRALRALGEQDGQTAKLSAIMAAMRAGSGIAKAGVRELCTSGFAIQHWDDQTPPLPIYKLTDAGKHELQKEAEAHAAGA